MDLALSILYQESTWEGCADFNTMMHLFCGVPEMGKTWSKRQKMEALEGLHATMMSSDLGIEVGCQEEEGMSYKEGYVKLDQEVESEEEDDEC